MPLADYECPACGTLHCDVYFPIALGQTAAAPNCPWHGMTPVKMRPIIHPIAVDAKGVFQRFEITRQVVEPDPETGRPTIQNKLEVIDSVTKLRQVERDSEQRFRNGEGEPLRFRMWSNGATNRDVSTFGDSGKIGDEEYTSGAVDTRPKKSGKISITRHGETAPEVITGPGMHGNAVSAVKD